MIDKILVILGSLIIAILLTIFLLDYHTEYKLFISILSLSGFIIMIIQYLFPKK